jgi:hypothetical protein
MSMPFWTPKAEGNLELSEIMQPLTPVRDRVLVLSGMTNKHAFPLVDEGDGDHSRCQAAYLTGVHANKASGKNTTLHAGVSMDQIVARKMEKDTQLASLELSLESNELAGQCEDGYGCAYSATIAWRDATTPLPMEANPRVVFEHLFGASDSTARDARLRRIRSDASLLDSVAEELKSLRLKLGRSDRSKLTGYLDSVRDIERRIQIAEAQSDRELPEVPQPAGIPARFEDYATVMFDLMAVAFQADLTRVGTFLYGREKNVRTYPEIGVPDPHHPSSHHQNRPEALEKLAKINQFHMQLFARFLQKLGSTPDDDGTLLDNTVFLYGAGMSNSNAHIPANLPLLLAGGGGGTIKGGRHVKLPADTPVANLHLTLIEKMGIPAERFADSTSGLNVLSEV